MSKTNCLVGAQEIGKTNGRVIWRKDGRLYTYAAWHDVLLPLVLVEATGRWSRRMGYLGSSLEGQVTKLRVEHTVCYARENLRIKDTFLIHSSARLGLGGGIVQGKVHAGIKAGDNWAGTQVLELCAPADRWEECARIIRLADARDRPVLRNRQFTKAWAERHLDLPEPQP
jgi:hypothetical protein